MRTGSDASWVHRLGAGWKLFAVAAAGTVLLPADSLPLLLAAFLGVAGLYVSARIPVRRAVAQLRPVVMLLTLVFGAQLLFVGGAAGAVAVLRLGILIMLAGLVNLTTTAAAMTASLEAGLRPLARFGCRPRAVALALALAMRFVPLLAERAAQVREAQRARGLERSFIALAIPLIVQSLGMAHALAEAIEARGFDPDEQ